MRYEGIFSGAEVSRVFCKSGIVGRFGAALLGGFLLVKIAVCWGLDIGVTSDNSAEDR